MGKPMVLIIAGEYDEPTESVSQAERPSRTAI